MAAGEFFSTAQVYRIEEALERARNETGVHFSAYVGDVGEPSGRAAAEALHDGLGELASRACLIVVSPGDRTVEVVTGHSIRKRLPDRACALAALSMTTAFSGGDLAGGLVTGVRMLADTAGKST